MSRFFKNFPNGSFPDPNGDADSWHSGRERDVSRSKHASQQRYEYSDDSDDPAGAIQHMRLHGDGASRAASIKKGEEQEIVAIRTQEEQETSQTKEVIELELEKLFFAGKAKCVNGHVYKRICMMGPCPICNGLQYQFSPDEPLFDYDYEPEPSNDETNKAEGKHRPSTSRGADGNIHDAVYDQIERDRLYALELQAEEEDALNELPNFGPIVSNPRTWIHGRSEAENSPPAPPEKILSFYIDFKKIFLSDVEFQPRENVEARLHDGYILPPFPSLTMDEQWAVMDARAAKTEGRKYVQKLLQDKEFRLIMKTSKRYHELNPLPVTLTTDIFRQEFRRPRDRIWYEIKAEVEKEMNAKEGRKIDEAKAKNTNTKRQADEDKDKN